MAECLPVDLAPGHKQGLLLANPVMPAAGTFGYGLEYEGLMETEQLGAIVTTPTTLRPQRGQPQPRLQELKDGLLLGTGGQNPGLGRVLREYAPRWARGKVPVILNIAGPRPAEFASVARRLDNAQGIWGLELTLPDRATSPEARGIVAAVRALTLLPLWAKLPLFRAEDLADVCLDAGANALTVGLPPLGMSLDLAAKARLVGRLYGRMVKPLALRAVDAVAQCVQAPIIASGGIHTVEDALEFLALGASAVQVGSATWVEPGTMLRIVKDIAAGQQTERLDGVASRH
jgi:dihydroorotate dehydrogenase (NAD+) catalytic subunit